jgi:hypothetical protein
MKLIDISKLRKYEITYIPKFDSNSIMKLKTKIVVADSEAFARNQIMSKHKKAKILNLTIVK